MSGAAAFPLLAAAAAGVAAYMAAPTVAAWTRRDLKAAGPKPVKKERRRAATRTPEVLQPLRTHAERAVAEAGYRGERAWALYLACLLGVPALLILFATIAGRGPGVGLGAALAAVAATRATVAARKARRSRALTRNAYKAYRFLDAQIGSGVRATDAVRGLHEVMDDREVRDAFVRFVAAYELTLDLDRSLDELRRSFGGYDCEMLCVGIRQCIDTGGAGRMLWRMEEIMFSKYVNGVQKETEGVRTRIVAAALLSASPLALLFLLPVLYDAYRALGGLFA